MEWRRGFLHYRVNRSAYVTWAREGAVLDLVGALFLGSQSSVRPSPRLVVTNGMLLANCEQRLPLGEPVAYPYDSLSFHSGGFCVGCQYWLVRALRFKMVVS